MSDETTDRRAAAHRALDLALEAGAIVAYDADTVAIVAALCVCDEARPALLDALDADDACLIAAHKDLEARAEQAERERDELKAENKRLREGVPDPDLLEHLADWFCLLTPDVVRGDLREYARCARAALSPAVEQERS